MSVAAIGYGKVDKYGGFSIVCPACAQSSEFDTTPPIDKWGGVKCDHCGRSLLVRLRMIVEVKPAYKAPPKPRRWSLRHDHCRECGGTESPHHYGGVCKACEERRRAARSQDPDKLRLRGPHGTFGAKREDAPWSARHERCVDCGTTEKPHMARGRCNVCYANWRYANVPGCAERAQARSHKRYSENRETILAYERDRRKRPERIEQHRKSSTAWARRNSPWPPGCRVEYEAAPGALLLGTIEQKTTHSALVKFDQGAEGWIPFSQLRRLEE